LWERPGSASTCPGDLRLESPSSSKERVLAMKQILSAKTVSKPMKPTFSQGVKVDAKSLVFVSGQVAFDKNGNIVGKGDAYAQTMQALENMRLVLAEAGMTFDNVVSVKVYLKDMKDFEAVHRARAHYFLKEPPSSTLVQITQLVHPDLLVEIDAVAAL
jgi:2-iminobutanoate/2-iminopropanoate deaminase